MAKVGAKLGLTLKLFKNSQYEFVRPEISIDAIDTDQDVDGQIERAVVALRAVFDATEKELDSLVVSQMPNVSAEAELQISSKLKKFQEQLDGFETKLKKIAKQ